MRWGFLLAVAASFLLSASDLSAQSRGAAMTVSVTVVRSPVSGQSTANGSATVGGATAALPAGSAENPRPAPPRETEAEVQIPTPSSTDASSSVMMTTINY
jgi:hypothetical protein